MTVGLKKFSDYNPLTSAALRGDETFLLADTASTGTVTATTISATAATNTISDSGGGLPVVKPGALVLVSGFTDTAAELNGLHTVVSSDVNALVVATDITVDEAAGQSVTISEVKSMYQVTLDELAAYIAVVSTGLPVPDTTAVVKGSADATKQVRFEVDGLTTASVRVLTIQDLDLIVAGINVKQTYTAAQRSSMPALTVDTAMNMDGPNSRTLTLTGSNTLPNPTNLTAGQSGVIYVTKTNAGDSLAYGTYWPSTLGDFAAMSVGQTGAIYYSVIDSTHIDASTKYPVGP